MLHHEVHMQIDQAERESADVALVCDWLFCLEGLGQRLILV
jgi:hypothetical protein